MVIYFNNMTTIGYITNKLLNMDNNVFSLNYDKSDPVKPLMKLVFISLVNNRYKGKFNMFKETLISFLQFSRDEFINFFCKIQKTYYAFSRLAFIYKYKKSAMSVTTDIGLNDITINDKTKTRIDVTVGDILHQILMAAYTQEVNSDEDRNDDSE